MKKLRYKVNKISDYKWEIPKGQIEGMRVPCIIFANENLLIKADQDNALEQVVNVATLPGVVKASFAMPDIHWGYGFPIGGVAAMNMETGVISPGGVGFDISCGVRLIKTNLTKSDIKPKMEQLVYELNRNIPKGVGVGGKLRLSRDELSKLVTQGVQWAIKKGYGWNEDRLYVEDRGRMPEANPDKVSYKALKRGQGQVGTLGAGNHYLEIQVVDQIYDKKIAEIFGLEKDQVAVMIHCGSRGFGHQVCSDYIEVMRRVVAREGYKLPDRQLGCAPINSKEGKDYYQAMSCAANYALTNRHVLGHWMRQCFERVFKKSAEKLGMNLIYDVSHNIAKFEKHKVDGKEKMLCIHRKGATRAFGPGHPDLPEKYSPYGQPVIIGGTMGTASYLLIGTEKSMEESFGSTCHGAGRVMSRRRAKKTIRGDDLKRELESSGIKIMTDSMPGLAEEAPKAYKDVNEIVDVTQNAGISTKVVKLKPLAVLKG